MNAVKQWRYQPYGLNGNPILVLTETNVNIAWTERRNRSIPPAGAGSRRHRTAKRLHDFT